MAVFAVIAPEVDSRLEPAVRDVFADSFYKISDTQFLVSAPKLTTNQVAEKLGSLSGNVGRVLIVRFTSFTGWHYKNLWEWIAAQTNPPPPSLADPMEPTGE
jgi:hypothetical protein